MTGKTKEATVKALAKILDRIKADFGKTPQRILSDAGKEFNNDLVHDMLKERKIVNDRRVDGGG